MGFTISRAVAKPELAPGTETYWEAWQLLGMSRPVGMAGASPIPVSEIHAYCEMFSINDLEERARLLRFIVRMDAAWITSLREGADKEGD